jgi:hypothetical protein
VGQQLTISGAGTTPGTPAPPGTPQPCEATTHVVKRGEYLNQIARVYGSTWQAIATTNNLVNPNLIYPGQQLTIPCGSTVPVTPAPGVTVTPGGPPPATGAFELGGQALSFSFPDQMRGAGMTWVKRQVVYNQGDPANVVQSGIDDAHAKGFKVLLSVIGNKGQIAANPTQYYQDFAVFLGDVAALGADGIEVWNEMNIDREWPSGLISGAQYTQMLSAAYQAIKAKNPNTMVISGAPAPTGAFGGCSTSGCDDDKYIAQMAAAGAGQFMDCVGIHYNSGTVSPTATSGAPVGSATHYSWYYPSLTNLYASTFPGKPLCYTELGYLTSEGYGPLPPAFNWAAGTTIANQAQWLAQAADLSKKGGRVRLMIVWNVDSTDYGADPQAGYAIIRADGTCPACNSLAQVMK